ncbi:hypothetical protein F6W70_05275 [Microbacterium maritypicum]|uniref:Uncharacterized protein n=1 Tax=Microbacterium maritypicum TaxID=33918 RepID=A0AAD3X5F2_MICMQ|nr:DUF6228 family protein [Microbacterium liquefaciens]KAB1886840.1 hypothetical protein F6W70_05275 [Microbacterium liquefaciens]
MATDEVSQAAGLGDTGMSLDFSDPQFDESGKLRSLQARLHGTRLDAQLTFYVWDVAEIVCYFRALDQDWRGWSGERQYESVEGDLVLSARHLGRIELSVTLTGEAARDISTHVGWTAQAIVGIEPGEELSLFVRDFDSLVARATE